MAAKQKAAGSGRKAASGGHRATQPTRREPPTANRQPARLPAGKTAPELLDMYFLDARMHLLETAAMLDRLERARNFDEIEADPRLGKLREAALLLADGHPERAERFQRLFSVE